jgi:hypothetical protein
MSDEFTVSIPIDADTSAFDARVKQSIDAARQGVNIPVRGGGGIGDSLGTERPGSAAAPQSADERHNLMTTKMDSATADRRAQSFESAGGSGAASNQRWGLRTGRLAQLATYGFLAHEALRLVNGASEYNQSMAVAGNDLTAQLKAEAAWQQTIERVPFVGGAAAFLADPWGTTRTGTAVMLASAEAQDRRMVQLHRGSEYLTGRREAAELSGFRGADRAIVESDITRRKADREALEQRNAQAILDENAIRADDARRTATREQEIDKRANRFPARFDSSGGVAGAAFVRYDPKTGRAINREDIGLALDAENRGAASEQRKKYDAIREANYQAALAANSRIQFDALGEVGRKVDIANIGLGYDTRAAMYGQGKKFEAGLTGLFGNAATSMRDAEQTGTQAATGINAAAKILAAMDDFERETRQVNFQNYAAGGASQLRAGGFDKSAALVDLGAAKKQELDQAGTGLFGSLTRAAVNFKYAALRTELIKGFDDRDETMMQRLKDRTAVTGLQAKGLDFSAQSESIRLSAEEEADSFRRAGGSAAGARAREALLAGRNQLQAYRLQLQRQSQGSAVEGGFFGIGAAGSSGTDMSQLIEPLTKALDENTRAQQQLTEALNSLN